MDGKYMRIRRFARLLDDMQRKLIHKEGRKSITDDAKIRKFVNNIPDIIKKSIKRHLIDDMTQNDIITKSE